MQFTAGGSCRHERRGLRRWTFRPQTTCAKPALNTTAATSAAYEAAPARGIARVNAATGTDAEHPPSHAAKRRTASFADTGERWAGTTSGSEVGRREQNTH